MSKKQRARTDKRIRERAAKKLVHAREELASLEPGGSDERPIVVETSSVIEVKARAMRCPQCDGETKIVEHRAPRDEGGRAMRAVDVECLLCGTKRTRWFEIRVPLAN